MFKTLIVESDVNTNHVLQRLVSLQGHEAFCAASLAEAVEQMSKACPDRILVELNLPDGNGSDLLRRIRQLDLPVRVGVVACAHDEIPKSLHALAPDFIATMPLDVNRLIHWLSEPLDSPRKRERVSA
jgi:DNA-binding NtrC family response regulator